MENNLWYIHCPTQDIFIDACKALKEKGYDRISGWCNDKWWYESIWGVFKDKTIISYRKDGKIAYGLLKWAEDRIQISTDQIPNKK